MYTVTLLPRVGTLVLYDSGRLHNGTSRMRGIVCVFSSIINDTEKKRCFMEVVWDFNFRQVSHNFNNIVRLLRNRDTSMCLEVW